MRVEARVTKEEAIAEMKKAFIWFVWKAIHEPKKVPYEYRVKRESA